MQELQGAMQVHPDGWARGGAPEVVQGRAGCG